MAVMEASSKLGNICFLPLELHCNALMLDSWLELGYGTPNFNMQKSLHIGYTLYYITCHSGFYKALKIYLKSQRLVQYL